MEGRVARVVLFLFVCFLISGASPRAAAAEVANCIDSWCWLPGHAFEYFLSSNRTSAADAVRFCAAERASSRLALPDDETLDFYSRAVASQGRTVVPPPAWVDMMIAENEPLPMVVRLTDPSNRSSASDVSSGLWAQPANGFLLGRCFALVPNASLQLCACEGRSPSNTTTADARHEPAALCRRPALLDPPTFDLGKLSPLEFSYFPQQTTWSAARDVCIARGGNLAYVPQPTPVRDALTLALVAAIKAHNATTPVATSFWFGLTQMNDRQTWEDDFTEDPYVATIEAAQRLARQCVVSSTALVFTGLSDIPGCDAVAPFLCARLATPASGTQRMCAPHDFAGLLMFVPYALPQSTTPSTRHSSVTPDGARTTCGTIRWGALATFENSVQTGHARQCFGDAATASIAEYLPTEPAPSCAALGLAQGARRNVPCTRSVAGAVCNVSAPSNSTPLQMVPLEPVIVGLSCVVNVTAQLSSGLTAGQNVSLCSSFSQREYFEGDHCFRWVGPGDVNATVQVRRPLGMTPPFTRVMVEMNFDNCSICNASATPAAVLEIAAPPTVEGGSVLRALIEDFPPIQMFPLVAPPSFTLEIGTPLTSLVLDVPVGAGAVHMSLWMRVEGGSAQCEVTPAQARLTAGGRVPVGLFCLNASSDAVVALVIDLKSVGAGNCRFPPSENLTLARFTGIAPARSVLASSGSILPWAGVGSPFVGTILVRLSAPPGGLPRRTATWLCVGLHDAPAWVVVAPACFFSGVSTSLESKMGIQVTDPLQSANFTAKLVLSGSAAPQYLGGAAAGGPSSAPPTPSLPPAPGPSVVPVATATVIVTPHLLKLTGSLDMGFLFAPLRLAVELPVAFPEVGSAALSLTVTVSFEELVAALPTGPPVSAAACNLTTQAVTFTTETRNVTRQVLEWTPQCLLSGVGRVGLSGNAATLFSAGTAVLQALKVAAQYEPTVEGAPRILFLNAEPHVMNVTLPVQVTSNMSLDVVPSAACRGLLSVTGSLLWVPPGSSSLDASRTVLVRFVALFAFFDCTISLALQGRDALIFSQLPSLLVSTQNQTEVSIALVVSQYYFAGATYSATVTIRALPMGNGSIVSAVVSPSFARVRTVRPATFTATSSSTVAVLTFQITAIAESGAGVGGGDGGGGSGETPVTIPVELIGSGKYGYYPPRTSLFIASILPQSVVHVAAPPLLVWSSDDSSSTLRQKDVTVTLSRPSVATPRVWVTLTASSSLFLSRTELSWGFAESSPQTLQIHGRRLDENATLTITTNSTAGPPVFRLTGEVSQDVLPANVITIPIRPPGRISIELPTLDARGAINFVSQREAKITVILNSLPPEGGGDLSITAIGEAVIGGFIVVSDAVIFNSRSRSLTQFITIRGGLVTARASFSLEVSGSPALLAAYPSANLQRQYFVQITPLISVTPAWPINFIIGAMTHLTGTVTIEQLPLDGTVLGVVLDCQGCNANTQVTFEPPQLVWASNAANLTQDVSIQIVTGVVGSVVLLGTPRGSAKGFAPFSVAVELRNPSPVLISLPTAGRVFVGETAVISVNVSTPVVQVGKSLVIEVARLPTSTCDECELLAPTRMVFRSDTPASYQRFLVSTAGAPSSATTSFAVSFTVTGTAASEYNVLETLQSGTFLIQPRRQVRFVDPPTVFFAEEPTTILVALEANPQAGATISIGAGAKTMPGRRGVWVGTATGAGTISIPQPVVVRLSVVDRFLTLEATGSPSSELVRYQLPPPLPVVVKPKLFVSVVASETTLGTSLVVGSANNRTLSVRLNRLPHSETCSASVSFEGAFRSMLRFVPSRVVWEPDTGGSPSSSSSSLVRQFQVVGDYAGVASNIRLTLSGLPVEIDPSPAFSVPFARSLSVVALYVVSHRFDPVRLYVGPQNSKVLSLQLSGVVSRNASVRLSFSIPGKVRFNPSVVTWVAGGSTLRQDVVVEGLESSSVGELLAIVFDAPEVNPLVDGQATFSVAPLISVTVTHNGQLLAPGQILTLSTDETFSFALETNDVSLQETSVATLVWTFARVAATTSAPGPSNSGDDLATTGPVTNTSTAIPSPAVSVSPAPPAEPFVPNHFNAPKSRIVFDSRHPSDVFTVFAVSTVPFTASLSIVLPSSPQNAPPFNLTLHVFPDLELVVSEFPSLVGVGQGNARRFMVRPRNPPIPRTLAQVVARTTCQSTVAFLQQDQPLAWTNAAAGWIAINIRGNAVGPCGVIIQKSLSNSAITGATLFSATFAVVAAPTVELLSPNWRLGDSVSEGINETLVVPFQTVQSGRVPIFVGVPATVGTLRDGPLQYEIVIRIPAAATPPTSSAGSASNPDEGNPPSTGTGSIVPETVADRADTDKAAIVIECVYSEEDRPRGIAAALRRSPDRVYIEANATAKVILIVIGSLPLPYSPVEPEVITIRVGKRAFQNGSALPNPTRNSVRLLMEERLTSLVNDDTRRAAQIIAIGGMSAGIFWAPPLAFQATRTVAILRIFDCPVLNWRELKRESAWGLLQTFMPYSAGSVFLADRAPKRLSSWFVAGLSNSFLGFGALALHLAICAGRWMQRRHDPEVIEKGTFKDVCGSLRFPGLGLIVVLVLLLPTTESMVRVLFYSSNSSFRFSAAAVLLVLVVALPTCIHGVVWRNSSLEYRPIGLRRKDRDASWLVLQLRATGEWVHPTNPSYVGRYGFLFSQQRRRFRWYMLFEYGLTVAIAVGSAIEPESTQRCTQRAGVMAAIYVLQLVSAVLWRPFVRSWLNFWIPVSYLLQAVAMVLVAYNTGSDSLSEGIVNFALLLVVGASICWGVCGAGFLLVVSYEAFMKRWRISDPAEQSRLRRQQRATAAAAAAAAGTGDGSGDLAARLTVPVADNEVESDVNDENADQDDADDGADAAGAWRALETVEHEQARRGRRADGVFRHSRAAYEASFSPLRKRELELRERVRLEEQRKQLEDAERWMSGEWREDSGVVTTTQSSADTGDTTSTAQPPYPVGHGMRQPLRAGREAAGMGFFEVQVRGSPSPRATRAAQMPKSGETKRATGAETKNGFGEFEVPKPRSRFTESSRNAFDML